MTDLKPCPFCGGKAEYREMMGAECEYIAIHCTKCGMACTKYEGWGAVDMVEDWNRRVSE